MKSLYDVLGVRPDASADAIKKAYRPLAQRHHPDREGGDAAAFAEIQMAYEVLSDPERRARYDLTGDFSPPVNHVPRALEMLAQMFTQLVNQSLTTEFVGLPDPQASMKRCLRGNLQAAETEVKRRKSDVKKLTKLRKRMSYRGTEFDVLGERVDTMLGEAEAITKNLLLQIETMKIADTLLNDFLFAPDVPDEPPKETAAARPSRSTTYYIGGPAA